MYCAEIPSFRPQRAEGVVSNGHAGGSRVIRSGLEVGDVFQAAAGVGEPGLVEVDVLL